MDHKLIVCIRSTKVRRYMLMSWTPAALCWRRGRQRHVHFYTSRIGNGTTNTSLMTSFLSTQAGTGLISFFRGNDVLYCHYLPTALQVYLLGFTVTQVVL